MKILVVCQYYYPEPFRINDLCEELVCRGHEVCVVTGEPNYPEGVIYKGYENHSRCEEIINGVKVHRCPIIPRKTGALYRFLNYYSFVFSSGRYVTSKDCAASDGTPFDVVFVNQLSPVMMAEPAIRYKRKHGVPVLMYCLDLWPESLAAGGISHSSPIFKVFHRISKRIYRSMNRILVTSRQFCGYLKNEFHIEENNMEYLPQYAEDIFSAQPANKDKEWVDLLFAGNIGAAQSVDTVLKAAEILTDKPVHFHIVGSGSELGRLQEFAGNKKLCNVTFYGRKPLEDMPAFYNKADAMLVTLQADPVLSYTLPGKVQSYMAAGKPIIGAINGETAQVIKEANCGFCASAENAAELAENILRFLECSDKEALGTNARCFYEKNFARDIFMDSLEKELFKLIERN